MPRSPRIGLVVAPLLLGLLTLPVSAAETPARGAGKLPETRHKLVRRFEIGVGADSYWLFEPGDPKPDTAPVVVFNHGWFAVNPGVYGAWIDHLVRQGRTVVYPRYQNDLVTKPTEFLPNALAAVRDAFHVLDSSPAHVRPDRKRFALIGHSAGGNLAAQMAAVASENGLPIPGAVVAVLPGEVQSWRGQPSFADIPSTTLLVVTVAEDDLLVGDLRGRQIFSQATAIPSERKKFILFRTDLHGSPKLIADHLAPTGYSAELDSGDGVMRGLQANRAEIDALDHAGFWRVADITMEAAFRGMTLDQATARGEIFRHLGYWSDGRKVTPPVVSDDLSAIPRVFPPNGIRLINWNPRMAAVPPVDLSPR